MFLDRFFTPIVWGRFAKRLFTCRDFQVHLKVQQTSKSIESFSKVLAPNVTPKEGLQKAQWILSVPLSTRELGGDM